MLKTLLRLGMDMTKQPEEKGRAFFVQVYDVLFLSYAAKESVPVKQQLDHPQPK